LKHSKTVLLMRHAKSSWKDGSLDDHSRPLNNRGIAAAKTMGAHLKQQGLVPEYVYCSTAQRTRQTLELASKSGGWSSAAVEFADELYLAHASTLLEYVKTAPGSQVSLVLGHNPGMELLVGKFYSQELAKFPTGAVAVLRCGDSIVVEEVFMPRDLLE
jgi:phosphohistidine phosphatase